MPAARSRARRRAKTDERWFRHRRPSRSSRTSCRPATLAVVSESTREPEAIDVVYLPYLPLRNRAVVGQWELIPRGALADDDCLEAWAVPAERTERAPRQHDPSSCLAAVRRHSAMLRTNPSTCYTTSQPLSVDELGRS